ncbi:MAG TPA: N-acetyltransferase [Ktedonobacteraceae bacterium]|jgi:ribosomal protein S18 acetylase RimI-like enzyme|nr:N-acetyltransferase [Ktedonobacteraceae bacterium]
MNNELSTSQVTIRLATPEDLPQIEHLDSLSSSPTRHIHREVEKYFGSIDPSTHEHTFIFLAELQQQAVGKAELMVPPADAVANVGYIKRVIVHPDFRGQSISRRVMQHIVTFARTELHLSALDLHVWENNLPAIHLYEALGFALQHRELYYHLDL